MSAEVRIEKCHGYACTKREECQRFTRPAAAEHQFWREYEQFDERGSCMGFVPLYWDIPISKTFAEKKVVVPAKKKRR